MIQTLTKYLTITSNTHEVRTGICALETPRVREGDRRFPRVLLRDCLLLERLGEREYERLLLRVLDLLCPRLFRSFSSSVRLLEEALDELLLDSENLRDVTEELREVPLLRLECLRFFLFELELRGFGVADVEVFFSSSCSFSSFDGWTGVFERRRFRADVVGGLTTATFVEVDEEEEEVEEVAIDVERCSDGVRTLTGTGGTAVASLLFVDCTL